MRNIVDADLGMVATGPRTGQVEPEFGSPEPDCDAFHTKGPPPAGPAARDAMLVKLGALAACFLYSDHN
jgi:hypothetical protein